MQRILNYFQHHINIKRLFLWVLFISLINGGFIYFFHTVKEKNYEILTLKDTILANDIVTYSQQIVSENKDNENFSYQKLQSQLRKKFLTTPERMELFLIDPQMSNFNHGIVFYQYNENKTLMDSELIVSFTNIPKNQCPKFVTALIPHSQSMMVNGINIYQSYSDNNQNAEKINASCHSLLNLISFSFFLKHSPNFNN